MEYHKINKFFKFQCNVTYYPIQKINELDQNIGADISEGTRKIPYRSI